VAEEIFLTRNVPRCLADSIVYRFIVNRLFQIILATSFAVQFGKAQIALDFDAVSQPGSSVYGIGEIYEEDGFVVVSKAGLSTIGAASPFFNGSTALFCNDDIGQIGLCRTNSAAFDLHSLELSKVQYPQSGWLLFVGYRGASLVASNNVYVDLGSVPQTVLFAEFTNLTEVQWLATPLIHQFDKIVVTPSADLPPTPKLNITGIDSIVLLQTSYLQIGKVYSLERSTDLRSWTNLGQFTAYNTTVEKAAFFEPDQPHVFFRLSWAG
jgi:hypothetical protein